MSAEEELAEIDGVDPTPIHHPVDDEAIASAVNEAAAEVAEATMDVAMAADAPVTDSAAEGNATGTKEEEAEEEAIDESTEAALNEENKVQEPPETSSDKPDEEVAKGGETVLESTQAPTDIVETENNTSKKETKKRTRRVGKIPARKVTKLEDGSGVAVLTSTDTPTMVVQDTQTLAEAHPRVLSKHDEKWNNMFQKLLAYKNEHNSTLVPQCYDVDARLGRWVHYQRVEYWIYQQSGGGKITPERINRLDSIGFEWDPQRAQWNTMFEKLLAFREEKGHCKVPKGYTKDPELANWVRNQRLECANMLKGKKSRMTQDRYKKLDDLGFRWSTTTTPKKGKGDKHTEKEDAKQGNAKLAVDGTLKAEDSKPKTETVDAPAIKSENVATGGISGDAKESVEGEVETAPGDAPEFNGNVVVDL